MTSSAGIIPETGFYNASEFGNGWNSTSSDTTPADWMALTGVAVGVVVSVLGIFGNSVTIEAYRRNRKLQTSFNHLITNLCIVDLVFSVLVMPMILPLVATGDDFYPRQLCTALGFVYYWTLSSSVINLVFIAFNRYVGIVHSSKYRKIFSKDRIKWWLVAVWISAPILYMPFLIFDAFSWRESSLRCALSTSKLGMTPLKFYQIAVNILLQLIPAIALIVLYRAILRKVKKCRKSVEHYPTPFSVSPTGGDQNELSRVTGGRRMSTSRPPSPQKVTNESASGQTANNTPEKRSMSYLQVPMATPTKGGNKKSEPKEAQKRNGKHLTAMSSPDLFISGGKRDSFNRGSRTKQDVSRRKSWGDNSDTTSLKNGIFRMRSEHTLNSTVRMQDVTILSTIDSEPTSKAMSVDHNDNFGTEEGATVVEAPLSSANEKIAMKSSSLLTSGDREPQSLGTEDGVNHQRPNLLGCEKNIEEGSIQSSSHLSPTVILEDNLNLKDEESSRRQLRPLKRIMSIGGVKEGIIRSRENAQKPVENCEGGNCPDCDVGKEQVQEFMKKRSFTIPIRRNDSRSGSQRSRGSRKRARSVGINKFPKRVMTSSKNSTPKIVIDHATSDDARTSYTCNHDNCKFQDRDEESTSSLVAAFARSDRMRRYKSREKSQEECRWCQNFMRKILKNYRSNSVPDAKEERSDQDAAKDEERESVFNGAQQDDIRDCVDRSFSIASVKHPTSELDAESSSLKNQNSSLSVDIPGPTSDCEDRRVSVGSVGSRLYRYSIGGVDDGVASRQDSLSCAGYEYTTTRTNYQRNPSRTNNDIGIPVKKTKLNRHKSIYTNWRRKSFLNSSLHSSTSTDSRRRQRRREAERHLAYSGLIICAAFAICVLPTSVISVLAGILKIRITATVKFAAGMLSWCHAVVNPILYGFLNPKYRLEFRRMLHDLKYCWRLGCCSRGHMDTAGSQMSITSGIRNSRSWNPSSWWESARRPSAIPQRL